MAQLVLHFFGGFDARLAGERLTCFDSDKGRALLAYLAIERALPHRRESLAALLWPDRPEPTARANLRHVLHVFRPALAPFLLISPTDVQFNSASSCWLDVAEFERLLLRTSLGAARVDEVGALEAALALYCGDLLAGLGGLRSEAFESWLVVKQEHYHGRACAALESLGNLCEARGEFERALPFAQRLIDLEPWREEAHRRKMRCLAAVGDVSAALHQYEVCRQLLQVELGVEPSAATVDLRDAIRRGNAARSPLPAHTSHAAASGAVFVDRQSEMQQLADALAAVRRGCGRAVVLRGEAGAGKSALMQEFARRCGRNFASPRVAAGRCSSQAGLGDPYLPFREAAAALMADAPAEVVDTLRSRGPHLPGVLFPRVPGLGETGAGAQVALFSEFTAVLAALAAGRPLLLMLDDLQWADDGTAALLFHLVRRVDEAPILVLAAHRPEVRPDLPIAAVLAEIQCDPSGVLLDLDASDGRGFVEALVDSEPNQLDTAFRDTLYCSTSGRPLFVLEVLADLQARGDIVRDAAGRWAVAREIDWHRRPARVEAVIARRMAALTPDERRLLNAASVEGETFTAELAADAVGCDRRAAVLLLSQAARQYDFVRSGEIERLEGGEGTADGTATTRQLSRYRFRHVLFQQYFYGQLDPAERMALHQAAAEAIERLYANLDRDLPDDLAPRLAYHYEAAGVAMRAADYILVAGERAVRLAALTEAARLYQHGLALVRSLPVSEQRRTRERDLLLLLADASAQRNWASPEAAAYATEARAVLRPDDPPELACDLLGLMAGMATARGAMAEVRQWVDELQERAEAFGSPAWLARAWASRGYLATLTGHHPEAIRCFERAAPYFDAGRAERTLLHSTNLAAAHLVWHALARYAMGHLEHAARLTAQALTATQTSGDRALLALQIGLAGALFGVRPGLVTPSLDEEVSRQLTPEDMPGWYAAARFRLGRRATEAGDVARGIADLAAGLDAWKKTGMRLFLPAQHLLLAQALAAGGELSGALANIDAGIECTQCGLTYVLPQLWCVRGEILMLREEPGDPEAAEAALQYARAQAAAAGSLLFELQADMALARLWAARGDRASACALLGEVIGRFTEGQGEPELLAARQQLETLCC